MEGTSPPAFSYSAIASCAAEVINFKSASSLALLVDIVVEWGCGIVGFGLHVHSRTIYRFGDVEVPSMDLISQESCSIRTTGLLGPLSNRVVYLMLFRSMS